MTILDKLKAIWNIANGKPTAYRISIKDGMILNGMAIEVTILDGDIVINRLMEENKNGGRMRCPLKAGIDRLMQEMGYAECDGIDCQLWDTGSDVTKIGALDRPRYLAGCGLMPRESRRA